MSKIEKIYGQCVATLLATIMIFCIFSAIFDALFERDFSAIGGHGARGDMYIAP